MRIFVSGETGVIGRRVVPMLVSHGHTVTAAGQTPPAHLGAGVTFAEADLFDVGSLKRAVTDHDAIINLATHMPSASSKMLFRSAWRLNDRIGRDGVANLVEAALGCRVGTIIQESFALTYPDSGDQWIDEGTQLDPSDYNKTVADAGKSVDRFSSTGGKGVALRFAAFYGPEAIQIRSYINALRIGWAALPGESDAYISSVSHDDAATAVVASLNVPPGAYTVVDDEPVRRAI